MVDGAPMASAASSGASRIFELEHVVRARAAALQLPHVSQLEHGRGLLRPHQRRKNCGFTLTGSYSDQYAPDFCIVNFSTNQISSRDLVTSARLNARRDFKLPRIESPVGVKAGLDVARWTATG